MWLIRSRLRMVRCRLMGWGFLGGRRIMGLWLRRNLVLVVVVGMGVMDMIMAINRCKLLRWWFLLRMRWVGMEMGMEMGKFMRCMDMDINRGREGMGIRIRDLFTRRLDWR